MIVRRHMQSLFNLRWIAGAVVTAAALSSAAASATAPSSLSTSAASQPFPTDPRTAQVRELLTGTLDVAVSPQTLFDVPLGDEVALRVEAARLRALLRVVAGAAQPATRPALRARRTKPDNTDVGSATAELLALDPAVLAARLELDRARLDFYDLGAERRAALLSAHSARQEAAQPRETEDERQAREAALERARALDAARTARTEAERVVADELARLVGTQTRIDALREDFERQRQEIIERRDTVLGWQRRVRDAKALGEANADAIYDALRRTLRASRDDLAKALDALHTDASAVPELGPDVLAGIPRDVPADAASDRRLAVGAAISSARRDERALKDERAANLLDEINTLNRERLDLLAALSAGKREAITGFTAAGWDQARSEARHLSLTLRYHQHATLDWIQTMRTGRERGVSAWRSTATLLPLLLAVAVFLWGRRKTQLFVRLAIERLNAADRAARMNQPHYLRRVARLLLHVHRPIEFIILFLVLSWLLPVGAGALLEVQLLSSIVAWTLAGSLIVNIVNVAAAGHRDAPQTLGENNGELRLRSLRLVGRTVIGFLLVLVLSARLVGEGTIFSWVFSTCWFAALPVFLVIVRWWRSTVFERLARVRKKTPLQSWVLANCSGWKSFAAAMVGAVQLFATGTLKLGRSWVSGFELARRVHAYLFKREIERIGDDLSRAEFTPLKEETLDKLDPERHFGRWLECPAEAVKQALLRRARSRQGALIAIVAARGMGKSSLLRVIDAEMPGANMLDCRADTRLADLRDVFDSSPDALLVDDAHTFIEPRIGGLAKFDEVVAFARAHCDSTTWVFAIDASVWPLIKRARDARPIFDETYVLAPWNEAQLGALLADRDASAGIDPLYDGLLDRLPAGADDIDRQDALNAKRAGYERMLWDHAGGNPGLALEAWRWSLAQDAAGTVHVRPLRTPDTAKLERLPDASLFVLRAVLQLAPTRVDCVAEATRLRPEEVAQDLRFGTAQGFYEERSGSVRVAWPWLRAVTRLLERRQLLVRP